MLNKSYHLLLITLLGAITLCHVACNKKIRPQNEGDFSFNIDTLTFDTVFTKVGSATKQFLIYNKEDHWTRISNVHLGRGNASPYYMNINGDTTKSINNIDIAPKDSVWVFVGVNIDPTNANNPFLETDSIVVSTSNHTRHLPLVAYGQNAIYINDSLIRSNTVWTNEKPYVILNSCGIDTNFILTIDKGCRIYMHANSKLYVFGTLQINGTKTDSVVFQGNRLDRNYFGGDIPGEWGGLYFSRSSKNSVINYTRIKNCGLPTGLDGLNAAIFVDSCAASGNPLLVMNNSEISYSIGYGIFGYNSNIKAVNCLIHTCGANNLGVIQGGKYNFEFCSFANFGTAFLDHKNSTILALLNYFQYEIDNVTYVRGSNFDGTFTNCIIYGNAIKGDEITVDKFNTWTYNLTFDHCLYKQSNDTSSVITRLNCAANIDPQFKSPSDFDFSLENTSPAKGVGKVTSTTTDIEDAVRANPPSVGCYE